MLLLTNNGNSEIYCGSNGFTFTDAESTIKHNCFEGFLISMNKNIQKHMFVNVFQVFDNKTLQNTTFSTFG